MKIKTPLLLLLFLNAFTSFSQGINLTAFTIPAELKTNANAVIRNSYTEITIESVDEMVVKKTRVITVLNKVGDSEIDTYAHYNNDTKITELSVRIFNALGKEIKKYSKGKFIDISAVDGGSLYSDDRVKYVDYTPTNYPYTVVFESEYKTSSTGFIPSWQPLESYYLAIENSEYKINNPKNLTLKTKENNFKDFAIQKVSDSGIHYKMTNQPAIKYERNSYSFVDLMPRLLVSLNNFTLKGVPGNATDWKTFGKWMNDKLLLGRDKLDPLTIAKAKELVANAKTDVEKAKILYNYMQNKTRYISVQVGIGGWEPIAANEVDKVGYGDCKGLTNYTKALFDAVGIKSNYTVLYAQNRRDIDSEFASMQGNHVILNLPNNGNDIWLECTSQSLPFGFLGDFTDDRDVLVVTPEGGVIKRTPAYKNDTNLQTTNATIQLNEDGSLAADIKCISEGIQYNQKYGIEGSTKEDLEKYYKTKVWSYNNNLNITSVDISNNKDDVVFTESLKVSIQDFASKNDSEYIFRANVFNRNSFIPKRYRNRKLPLKISRGYKDVDAYTFKIPEGYSIGILPLKKEIKTKFGEYAISFEKVDETTLKYHKTILIKDGVYPKEDYKLYRKFRRSIAKLENMRIALVKK